MLVIHLQCTFIKLSTNIPGAVGLAPGCLYEGRWHREGSTVSTGEACLHCACSHGALSCRRRACAPLPDPPPHRCHVLHRRGSCCPELHCPGEYATNNNGVPLHTPFACDIRKKNIFVRKNKWQSAQLDMFLKESSSEIENDTLLFFSFQMESL